MAANPGKSMEQLVEALRSRREHLQQGGGAERLAKQKEEGKLTARERIDALVDPRSFEEIGLFAQHFPLADAAGMFQAAVLTCSEPNSCGRPLLEAAFSWPRAASRKPPRRWRGREARGRRGGLCRA